MLIGRVIWLCVFRVVLRHVGDDRCAGTGARRAEADRDCGGTGDGDHATETYGRRRRVSNLL